MITDRPTLPESTPDTNRDAEIPRKTLGTKIKRGAKITAGTLAAIAGVSTAWVHHANAAYLRDNPAYDYNPSHGAKFPEHAKLVTLINKTHFGGGIAGEQRAKAALKEVFRVRNYEVTLGGLDDQLPFLESRFPQHISSLGPLQVLPIQAREAFIRHRTPCLESGLFPQLQLMKSGFSSTSDFDAHLRNLSKSELTTTLELHNFGSWATGTLYFLDLRQNWLYNSRNSLAASDVIQSATTISFSVYSLTGTTKNVLHTWRERTSDSPKPSEAANRFAHAAYPVASNAQHAAALEGIENQWSTLKSLQTNHRDGELVACDGVIDPITERKTEARLGEKINIRANPLSTLMNARVQWNKTGLPTYCDLIEKRFTADASDDAYAETMQVLLPLEHGTQWASGSHVLAAMNGFDEALEQSSIDPEQRHELSGRFREQLGLFVTDRNPSVFVILTSPQEFDRFTEGLVSYKSMCRYFATNLMIEQGFANTTGECSSRFEEQRTALGVIKTGDVNTLYRAFAAELAD